MSGDDMTRTRSSDQFLEDEGKLVHLSEAKDAAAALVQVPVTVCSLALGIVDLGLLWLATSQLLLPTSEVFELVAVLIAVVACFISSGLLSLYIAKIVAMGPSAFLDELWISPNDPANMVKGTMALMSIALTLSVFGWFWVAAVLWVVGLFGHLFILCIFLTQAFRMGLSNIEVVNATWAVPTTGLAVAAGSGLAIGFGEWVVVFFWVPLLFFFYFYPLAVYRIYFVDPPVPAGLIYTQVVLIAPPSMLFIQYMLIGGGLWQLFPFTHVLYFLIICAIVAVAFAVPQIYNAEFNTTAAAMTFPLALAAKATLAFWFAYMSEDRYLSLVFLIPVVLLFVLANAVVLWVSIRFVGIFLDWFNNTREAGQADKPATDGPNAGKNQDGYQTTGSVSI